MPRSRNKAAQQEAQHADVVSEVQEVPANNGTIKERVNKMAELSLEQINELLSNTKSRGEYVSYLKEFVDSQTPGTEVDLTEGILAGKSVDKAYTGLTNAQKGQNLIKDGEGNVLKSEPKVAGAEQVKVIRSADKKHVFLINRALVNQ